MGESGLSTRLFTPIAALAGVPLRIEGDGTLLRRPMTMMIAPLRQLGVEVRHRDGFLPFDVCGPLHSATVEVDGSVSSQFITGLLLALTALSPLLKLDYDAIAKQIAEIRLDTETVRTGVEVHNRGASGGASYPNRPRHIYGTKRTRWGWRWRLRWRRGILAAGHIRGARR